MMCKQIYVGKSTSYEFLLFLLQQCQWEIISQKKHDATWISISGWMVLHSLPNHQQVANISFETTVTGAAISASICDIYFSAIHRFSSNCYCACVNLGNLTWGSDKIQNSHRTWATTIGEKISKMLSKSLGPPVQILSLGYQSICKLMYWL